MSGTETIDVTTRELIVTDENSQKKSYKYNEKLNKERRFKKAIQEKSYI